MPTTSCFDDNPRRMRMTMLRSVRFVTVVILVLLATAAAAQTPSAGSDTQTPPPAGSNPQGLPTITLPTVQVIGTTPLPGTGIDRDKVPANVQSLTASDLASEGSSSLINSLTDQAGSVNVNATLDDPFQP